MLGNCQGEMFPEASMKKWTRKPVKSTGRNAGAGAGSPGETSRHTGESTDSSSTRQKAQLDAENKVAMSYLLGFRESFYQE